MASNPVTTADTNRSRVSTLHQSSCEHDQYAVSTQLHTERDESRLPGVFGRRGQLPRELLHARLGDEEGVLELGGGQAVGGRLGPIIWPRDGLVRAEADHRLDGESVTDSHHSGALLVLVVEDVGGGVEYASHTGRGGWGGVGVGVCGGSEVG
jgi:hypothetical protein